MRIAARARELAKWGFPCATSTRCEPTCAGGMLEGVDWETCPIGLARKHPAIRVLRGMQAQRRVCGTLDASRMPAWLVRDLDDFQAWERHHGSDSGAQ